jgi:NodT family efflux transporter outer membrane factor (OMF) lipoprotein
MRFSHPDWLPRSARHVLLLGVALAALGGCAVGPEYARPQTPSPTRYTETPLPAQGGAGPHFAPGQDVAGGWWGLFRAPRLTALVVAALRQNPSLEAARQTLRQAQETALAQEGGFLPQISGQANRTREEISSGQAGLPNTFPGETYSVYDAQVNVSYTFDIWGQNRRSVEADTAQAAYQRFQLEGAATMLAANTVNAAIGAASLTAQIAAEEKLVGAERQLLATVRRQFELGGATGTDVATQEAQLANTEALVVPLQTQLGQTRDQLAAYTGRVPSEAEIPAIGLDDLTLPGEVPVSVPARLVEQRPDIRAAEAQLHAATAQLGVAIANRLPQLTLQGNIGSAPAAIGKFFTPGEGTFALIMQLAGPLFEGGTLLHQQRAAAAAMKAAAANYRNTVVTGFQNVADALVAVSHDGQALAANEAAERAAARSLSLAQMQYGAGGVAYLTVLTSQTQYQNAVIGLVRARAARFTDIVALYTALGGGWWNRNDLPPPPEGFWESLVP